MYYDIHVLRIITCTSTYEFQLKIIINFCTVNILKELPD